MQDQPTRQILQQAKEKFIAGDFNTAKSKLDSFTEEDKSYQLNKYLIQFETSLPENSESVLTKLISMLAQTNVDLYKNNRPKQINFISHEMLYLNIVAIAEYLGKNTLSQLIASQALLFYKCLQTTTTLTLLYQNLRRALAQNKPSSCLQLIYKFQKITEHARNLSPQQQKLKILINMLFICTLLKLEMVEQSQALFMLKFQQADSDKFTNQQKVSKTKRKVKIIYKDLINFLKSEIDFVNKNYQKSINSMLDYSSSQSNRQKIFAQNNIAINFCMLGKSIAAHKIFVSNAQAIGKVLLTNKKYGTELPDLFQKTKQNIMLSHLYSRTTLNSPTHYNVEADQRCYTNMKNTDQALSYKQQYRRGQCCLNLYHSLLQKSSRKLPWQQIHDNYDNVYYFPNQPYFQFKGRNKNVHLANKKPVYRRYVLNQWNDFANDQPIDKDQNRRKFQKQANSIKLNQILCNAEQSFRKSLLIIQKQQSILVKIQGAEADMAKIINQRLYHQYSKYKCSLLCLLTYTSLCLCKWNQVIKYAQQFTTKKLGQISAENNYFVLTYQMQAYSQLNMIQQAYKTMHAIVGNGLLENSTFDCRDGSNLSNCNVQTNVSQQINFIFNMGVLHTHNNRIPQSHQTFQKLFNQMNILQNYPKSELPLSVIELLLHYNLRTQNISGALQLIKRKRTLAVSNSIKPILNITK